MICLRKCLDENKTTVITRPTTNQPPIIIINASSGGYPTDVISNNILYYPQFYSNLQRNSEALKSYNNNHKYFSYSNVDYGSGSDANGFKELVFLLSNNIFFISFWSIFRLTKNFLEGIFVK